jgi:hypothetical protein
MGVKGDGIYECGGEPEGKRKVRKKPSGRRELLLLLL